MSGSSTGVAHAGAESLAQRFLGGEALGEKAAGIGAGAAGLALGGGQHLLQPALAVALPVVGHALDGDDVGADPVDHAGASACASRISRFISATASRMPTKMARLTMAWPMCSSRMPGSAATGCTLK
jgi:hypothetical protein